jgi:hypothetical protein
MIVKDKQTFNHKVIYYQAENHIKEKAINYKYSTISKTKGNEEWETGDTR